MLPRSQAGWKENLQTFTQELKNLQAFGMTHMGLAIKNTFDVLNLNRMQSGERGGWIEPAVQTDLGGGGG